jgi:hypothetical protein
MRILGALGLGLTILILRSLLPDVFQAFENTLLLFFSMADSLFGNIQNFANVQPISL